MLAPHTIDTALQHECGNLYSLPVRDVAEPFRDNAEHLTALEEEARSMLRVAWLEKGGLEEGACPKEARAALEKMRQENRRRELASQAHGVPLNFIELCNRYELCGTERDIVMLLAMRATAPNFVEQFKAFKYDADSRRSDGITAGALLNLISPNYADQLEARRHFSIEGRLIKEQLICITEMDETDSILNQMVCLLERYVRFIIGDNNLYMSAFRHIKRESPSVRLDQVVLPEGEKERIVAHLDAFMKRACRGNEISEMDHFYGYGTGLAMLFYGPSGVGKTMLAQALAAHCNCQLFSLRAKELQEWPASDEELLANLFREATLQGGIVLLDEADDIMRDNSYLSRALLLELEKARCVVILATNKSTLLDPALERRLSIKVSFAMPGVNERLKIWQTLLPPTIKLEDGLDLHKYANRYRISGGIIKNCLLMASTRALNVSSHAPVITRAILDEILEVQTTKAFERSGVCTVWEPSPDQAYFTLADTDKEEIKRAAKVYERLQKEGLGLSVVISAGDMETGRVAAALLASEVNLAVRDFDYTKFISRNKDDELRSPVTLEKVSTMRYAFSLAEEGGYITLVCDYDGAFDAALDKEVKDSKDRSILLADLQSELRYHRGLFIIISKSVKNRLPQEFNIQITLKHPGQEQQLVKWRSEIGAGIQPEEIVAIVNDYPLHLKEIEYIARQAKILSVLDNGGDLLSLKHIKLALEYHYGRRSTPLLFGPSL